MKNNIEYIISDYILPFAKWTLMMTGLGLYIALIILQFEEKPEYCRTGNMMSFPIDKTCRVEFNVEGKNFGWKLIPDRANSDK